MSLVITAGSKYVDIDVLGCSIAYKQLCDLSGRKASIHLTGPFNGTITSEIKAWSDGLINRTAPQRNDKHQYVIVDVSHPDYLESFVLLDKVIEIYDHHFGYETFWRDRLGNASKIEPVGACATLIWELYKRGGYLESISTISANTLYAAIVANTLNFRATVTTPRDIEAARDLQRFTFLPENWIASYYKEVERNFLADLPQTIRHDTKTVMYKGEEFFLSQIELWSAADLFQLHSPTTISQIMADIYPHAPWILSIISIDDGCNFLFGNTDLIERELSRFMTLTSIKTNNGTSYWQSDRLWLRKEILRDLDNF